MEYTVTSQKFQQILTFQNNLFTKEVFTKTIISKTLFKIRIVYNIVFKTFSLLEFPRNHKFQRHENAYDYAFNLPRSTEVPETTNQNCKHEA